MDISFNNNHQTDANHCSSVESIDRDSNGGAVTSMTISDYPEDLSKKITLLKYFRNYMSQHLLNVCSAFINNVPYLTYMTAELRLQECRCC